MSDQETGRSYGPPPGPDSPPPQQQATDFSERDRHISKVMSATVAAGVKAAIMSAATTPAPLVSDWGDTEAQTFQDEHGRIIVMMSPMQLKMELLAEMQELNRNLRIANDMPEDGDLDEEEEEEPRPRKNRRPKKRKR